MTTPKPLVRAKDNPEASPAIIVVGANTPIESLKRIARETGVRSDILHDIAGPKTPDIPIVGRRTFEENPRWNGPKKIPPTEMLITTGPGAIEGQYYPVIIKQRDILIVGEKNAWDVLARMKMGFDTEDEALMFAARSMRAVPILRHGKIRYPYFNKHATNAMDAAEARRERRAKKLQKQQDKQRPIHLCSCKRKHQGLAVCPTCKKPFNDTGRDDGKDAGVQAQEGS